MNPSDSNAQHAACELKRKVAAVLCLLVLAAMPGLAQPSPAEDHTGQPADAADHATGDEHAAEAHGGLSGLIWPTANFAVLCAGLFYFLREPFSSYLRDRHASIRKDLVAAAELRTTAAAQLAEIDRRLEALPGEIEALRRRGAEEIAAEERRIAEQAASERERLLEQTRREIELQVRLAKRELVEHAAGLAVQIATERIEREITPVDQQQLTRRNLEDIEKGQVH
ncbi:MAG: hypothetical protein ABR606_21490 [Vicinamibacterales bacterium]